MQKFNETYKKTKDMIGISEIGAINSLGCSIIGFYNMEKRLKREDVETGRSYVNGILDLIEDAAFYKCNTSYYAKSYEIYKKTKERNCPCYLFADDGCICFKGEEILDYFNHQKDFEYAVSKKAILTQLKYYGLLKSNGGEYSFPCRSANNKICYYHIYIEQLADLMYPHEYDSKLRQNFIDMLQE